MQKKEGQLVLFSLCFTRVLHLNVVRVSDGKDVILHIFTRHR
jgi:hypothetical protein